MRCTFAPGQVGAGSLKVLVGRNPFHGQRAAAIRPTETFREIWWRVYVKHETGWTGNPAKLARATCLAGSDWSQGLIAHVWGGHGNALCIDPATGITNSRKVTTKYNDFERLRWLGVRHGRMPIFSPDESGRWVCVESQVRLNTPGRRDGAFRLWVDGALESERTDLDWHGTWDEYGINAVFLENYWNAGSPKRQSRWFDDFVVGTRPVGPLVAANPVTLHRTTSAPLSDGGWEAQVAADPEGRDVVWNSGPVPAREPRLVIARSTGIFSGRQRGSAVLAPGSMHWLRLRWARGRGVSQALNRAWSPWHAPFRTLG
jgi:hypothetical protein